MEVNPAPEVTPGQTTLEQTYAVVPDQRVEEPTTDQAMNLNESAVTSDADTESALAAATANLVTLPVEVTSPDKAEIPKPRFETSDKRRLGRIESLKLRAVELLPGGKVFEQETVASVAELASLVPTGTCVKLTSDSIETTDEYGVRHHPRAVLQVADVVLQSETVPSTVLAFEFNQKATLEDGQETVSGEYLAYALPTSERESMASVDLRGAFHPGLIGSSKMDTAITDPLMASWLTPKSLDKMDMTEKLTSLGFAHGMINTMLPAIKAGEVEASKTYPVQV